MPATAETQSSDATHHQYFTSPPFLLQRFRAHFRSASLPGADESWCGLPFRLVAAMLDSGCACGTRHPTLVYPPDDYRVGSPGYLAPARAEPVGDRAQQA